MSEPPRAYSYLRFSTLEQMSGDSMRRQASAAHRYALDHGLELDTAPLGFAFRRIREERHRGRSKVSFSP